MFPPPQEAKDTDIKEYFGTFGDIENINLKMDPMTGRCVKCKKWKLLSAQISWSNGIYQQFSGLVGLPSLYSRSWPGLRLLLHRLPTLSRARRLPKNNFVAYLE